MTIRSTPWITTAYRVLLIGLGLLVGGLTELPAQPQLPQPPQPPQPQTFPDAIPSQPQPNIPPEIVLPVPVPGIPPTRPIFVAIDPKIPHVKLIPAAPSDALSFSAKLPTDLADVPEVALSDRPTADDRQLPRDQALQQAIPLASKAHHLNENKADGFIQTLVDSRRDLSGLPFLMGEACKTPKEMQPEFRNRVALIQQLLTNQISVTLSNADKAPSIAANQFWNLYQQQGADRFLVETEGSEGAEQECRTRAQIAAFMQVLAPMSAPMRKGLVQYLAKQSHIEATHALAKLAIFSQEQDIRELALNALQLRRQAHYRDILVQGLRYPWPVVAERSAEAIVKLGCKELTDDLLTVLENPDPRLPTPNGQDGLEIRELVRINHNRNCLLCHAPIDRDKAPEAEFLTAAIPLPSEPFASPESGSRYGHPQQESILVRLDVTYLRQDFSVMLPVKDAKPWPKMQRYDFLVRTRTLSAEQAKQWTQLIENDAEQGVSKYHRVASDALQRLTGKRAKPTTEAWRAVLSAHNQENSPAKTVARRD